MRRLGCGRAGDGLAARHLLRPDSGSQPRSTGAFGIPRSNPEQKLRAEQAETAEHRSEKARPDFHDREDSGRLGVSGRPARSTLIRRAGVVTLAGLDFHILIVGSDIDPVEAAVCAGVCGYVADRILRSHFLLNLLEGIR